MKKITNPMAKSLSQGLFKKRVVRPRKGKGSYKRPSNGGLNGNNKTIPSRDDD